MIERSLKYRRRTKCLTHALSGRANRVDEDAEGRVSGPGCVKMRTPIGWGGASGSAKPVSRADRFHQSANAQNVHHPFHIMGKNVQRHLGADVLERFHLEVRRSHPRLYRAEGMLDRLAAQAHLVRVSVEPRLHGLKDGFVLPA